MSQAGHTSLRRTARGFQCSRTWPAFTCLLLLLAFFRQALPAAEWQWSQTFEGGRAFLWIPPDCGQVRAIVVAQNNLIEPSVLESPFFRRQLARDGVAELFISPPFDPVFRFDQGAGERLETLLKTFATESGYEELATVPWVPLGHSACASFPWNLAAWKPERTLAILSVKGDAPQTSLTGSGKPNPAWGERSIDGIPALMVMSEGEWWEARLEPALAYRRAHPQTCLSVLADVEHGHFDASEGLIAYLAAFLHKAVAYRLPPSGAGVMKPLIQLKAAEGASYVRWRPEDASVEKADGPRSTELMPEERFWTFDVEMAAMTERYQASGRGKRRQALDFVEGGEPAPLSTGHAGVTLDFQPEADGVSFSLEAICIDPLPPVPRLAAKDAPPPPSLLHPRRAEASAHASGPLEVHLVTGPGRSLGGNRFCLALNRVNATGDRRGQDFWFVASQPGDALFKGAVQQALLQLKAFTQGRPQQLHFPEIPDQKGTSHPVPLEASSDAGLPVHYYVLEGPAEVQDGRLLFTALPPRARLPLRVTVVAWQWGRSVEPCVQTAPQVQRSFFILP